MTEKRGWSLGRITMTGVGAFIIIPIVATLIAATSVDFSKGPWGGGVTLDWLGHALTLLGPMLLRSFLVAIVVVVLNLVIGGTMSWWLPSAPRPVRALLLSLTNIPIAVPGIALSIALIATYPQLRPSGFLLVMGHLIFTLPFTLAALVEPMATPALKEQEQVARSLGASWPMVIATITVPWLRVAILQVITMCFALSFGEFNISFFINPPATSMAPFALFDAYSTQRLEIASAESTLFIACIIPVLAAVVWARHQRGITDE